VPFPYARLIVGKRHVQSPDFGNINNSDATGFEITRRFGKKPGFSVGVRPRLKYKCRCNQNHLR
jgi:hypothetical protein